MEKFGAYSQIFLMVSDGYCIYSIVAVMIPLITSAVLSPPGYRELVQLSTVQPNHPPFLTRQTAMFDEESGENHHRSMAFCATYFSDNQRYDRIRSETVYGPSLSVLFEIFVR
jgi:hypothetical protein